MLDLIPFVQQEEQKRVKGEIIGRKVSVAFDGTTRLGEAMVVILRFLNSNWTICQRLIRLQLLAKSMCGEEIARELVSVLQVQYDVAPNTLVAAMHDRAAVNNVAMRYVKAMYPSVLDIGCLSHTINIAGSKFKTLVLNEFLTTWLRLFSHSPKAHLEWKNQTSIPVKSCCETRWWSRWEVISQLLNLFGDVEPFLELLEDAGLATVAKMQSILSESKRKKLLQLELAAIVDAGQPFVKATYRLEGDGLLAFSCFEELDRLLQAVRIAHYPNVGRVAQVLSKGQYQVVQQLVEYAILCVQPGLTYIQDKLKSELLPQVNAFKATRLLHRNKVSEMQPDLVAVDALSAFPFLSPCEIGNLKAELPQYLALAGDVNPQVDINVASQII